jgi:uncharacterized protein YxjI
VLELRERPGKRPKVIVMSEGKKLPSVGERGVGLRDHFVIDTPLRAKFEIVGNAWSTAYSIMIDGVQAAQVMMEPGLAKADSCRVIIAKGKAPRILFGIILTVDILTHEGKH